MKRLASSFITLCLTHYVCAQEPADSLQLLEEVTVKSFEQNRKANSTAASVRIIEFNNADRYQKTSLVHGFNTIAGVRMEERSPGSYRINIRGSSLRSPFGVRNVKVYWNNIPITDPGGTTYFNQFAYNNFHYIELFKGPAGSMYGAGTGGLILLNNPPRSQQGFSVEYIRGSYHLHNVFATGRWGQRTNNNQVTFAHNQSDGYRDQSSMRRDNFSWQSQVKISGKQELSASILFNDMYYETPGALTLGEYTINPKAARPAAGGFPSAIDARAAIFQKNITAGFTSDYRIDTNFKNSTTLYGTFSQIKNSAIRNYERRSEPGYGGRSVFTYTHTPAINYTGEKGNQWQLHGGGEFQQAFINTQVSQNKNGNPDTLQTNDEIDYLTYIVFVQTDLSIRESWIINGGVSLNHASVTFKRLSNYPVTKQSNQYKSEIAPRLSIRKNFSDGLHAKVTVSRGFSPPTLSELLPSTGVINTGLEAEYGWNYEATAHAGFFNSKLQLELTGFYFKLNKALVQRRDISGADFFVNAGDARQKGMELTADYWGVGRSGTIANYRINAAYTYNHFRYGNFIKGTDNFTGNIIPSVPSHSVSLLVDIILKNAFYLNATYYGASEIFLNDANTAAARSYHLTGSRIGWKKQVMQKHRLNFYLGADNLFNQKYSLGNDINAAANRFYNAAPRRNYYAGASWQWIRPVKK